MPKKYFARCTYMWGQWVNSPCFPFFPPSPLFCSHRFHPLSSSLLLLPKGTMYRILKQRRKLSRARQKKGFFFLLRRIMCEGDVCPCLNKHRPVAPPPPTHFEILWRRSRQCPVTTLEGGGKNLFFRTFWGEGRLKSRKGRKKRSIIGRLYSLEFRRTIVQQRLMHWGKRGGKIFVGNSCVQQLLQQQQLCH